MLPCFAFAPNGRLFELRGYIPRQGRAEQDARHDIPGAHLLPLALGALAGFCEHFAALGCLIPAVYYIYCDLGNMRCLKGKGILTKLKFKKEQCGGGRLRTTGSFGPNHSAPFGFIHSSIGLYCGAYTSTEQPQRNIMVALYPGRQPTLWCLRDKGSEQPFARSAKRAIACRAWGAGSRAKPEVNLGGHFETSKSRISN